MISRLLTAAMIAGAFAAAVLVGHAGSPAAPARVHARLLADASTGSATPATPTPPPMPITPPSLTVVPTDPTTPGGDGTTWDPIPRPPIGQVPR